MTPNPATWDGQDSQGNPLRWDTPGLTWDGPVPQPPTTTTHMPQIRVSLGFAKDKDTELHDFTGTVSASLYGNAAYPSPPVLKTALDAANTAFDAAISAQPMGGTAATADKNNKRAALVALLRQLAGYVQAQCGNDLATLLASGFQAVTSVHSPTPSLVAAPVITGIKNGSSGMINLHVTPVKNSRGYIVRYAAVGAGGTLGPWQTTDPMTDSRNLIVSGLTPGTMYAFQVRATLGSSQGTAWSDSVQHMSL
jgi:hypothetical protein